MLESEWLKLRSVRSTYYVLAAVLVAFVLVAAVMVYAVGQYDGLPVARRANFSVSPPADLVSWVASLCLAVLGALTVTSEYANGMIRTSLTVAPRRLAMLAAKASVVAAAALVIGMVTTFGAFFAGRAIIGDRPVRLYTSPISEEIPMLLAQSLSVMVFALLGLGLGIVLRSTAGSIATVTALWYILPIIAMNLPAPWNDRISSVMLINLPRQLAGAAPLSSTVHNVLSPLGAAAAMAVYVLAPLTAAGILIKRRDI